MTRRTQPWKEDRRDSEPGRFRRGPGWGGSVVLGGLVALGLVASAWSGPIVAEDWTPEIDGSFGGRSEIIDGEFRFWTGEPLATAEDDVDDQRILYFQGFVPVSGPYALRASVRLPTTAFDPYDSGSEVVALYSLGIVASGLLDEGGESDLPSLRAAVVRVDVPEFGIVSGDVVLLWGDTEGGPPGLLRLDSPVHEIDLRLGFDGVDEMVFSWRPSAGSEPWRELATRTVGPRGGPSARAELVGQSANLLVDPSAAGAITAFAVDFVPPRIDSFRVDDPSREGVLIWETIPGATYSVWASSELDGWFPVASGIEATGDRETFRHRPDAAARRFFYRVRRD